MVKLDVKIQPEFIVAEITIQCEMIIGVELSIVMNGMYENERPIKSARVIGKLKMSTIKKWITKTIQF